VFSLAKTKKGSRIFLSSAQMVGCLSRFSLPCGCFRLKPSVTKGLFCLRFYYSLLYIFCQEFSQEKKPQAQIELTVFVVGFAI
jgi:hypothetical protein